MRARCVKGDFGVKFLSIFPKIRVFGYFRGHDLKFRFFDPQKDVPWARPDLSVYSAYKSGLWFWL